MHVFMQVNLGGYEFQPHTSEDPFTACLTNDVAAAGGTSLKKLTRLESSSLLEKSNLIV